MIHEKNIKNSLDEFYFFWVKIVLACNWCVEVLLTNVITVLILDEILCVFHGRGNAERTNKTRLGTSRCQFQEKYTKVSRPQYNSGKYPNLFLDRNLFDLFKLQKMLHQCIIRNSN